MMMLLLVGLKLYTPLQPIVRKISVPLSNKESVARSLDFDKSFTVSQFSPYMCSECTTPETLNESATSRTASRKRSPSIFARIAARISPAKSPPKVSPKSSSVVGAVLEFFTARSTPYGNSLKPESLSPNQQSQERSREDFSDQDEQPSVPSPCGQEPDRERGGLPLERSEGLGTADLVDPGHPAVEPLPSRPESSDDVKGTNVPAETTDVNPTSETPRTGEEDTKTGATGVRLDRDPHIVLETIPDISAGSDPLHHGSAERHAIERQDYSGLYSSFWAYCQTQRGTLPSPFELGERVIHPLPNATTGLPTDISGGHPQSHSAGTAPINPAGAIGPGDRRAVEEIGQLFRS
ncbi:hypothetical protein OUZ56_016453 [Daphnia magna]|uniref:Uncharacterized protein n=1 Tax=Daphnia magna TaxID=35525 RepID=A0ABR0AQL3_9CRUS|nr:hypothetical protein OUZ56_016453 [Daphnia magna]